MQIVNDAERDLSNGDICWVRSIAPDGETAQVAMQQGPVEYDTVQLRQFVLAYAVTAHKAQDSEFPIVIPAVDRSSFMLFDRTLLYTAMTRAKDDLHIVGDGRAIRSAVAQDESLNRPITLRSRPVSAQRSCVSTSAAPGVTAGK